MWLPKSTSMITWKSPKSLVFLNPLKSSTGSDVLDSDRFWIRIRLKTNTLHSEINNHETLDPESCQLFTCWRWGGWWLKVEELVCWKSSAKKFESANILFRKVARLHSSSFDLQIAAEMDISVWKKSFNLSYSATYRVQHHVKSSYFIGWSEAGLVAE